VADNSDQDAGVTETDVAHQDLNEILKVKEVKRNKNLRENQIPTKIKQKRLKKLNR
jgi:hypothetical protein